MNRRKKSIFINLLVILLEVLSIVYSALVTHNFYLIFYTELSNIIALIVSMMYIYYLIRNKKIPKYLSLLKYISVVNLCITFLVVVFILTPMSNFNYKAMFLEGIMLYHHLLCPLLCTYSFVFYDDLGKFKKEDIAYSLSFTFIYAIVMILLNAIGVVDGPYPFLKIRSQSIGISMLWMILIFSFSFLISYLLMSYYNRRVK